MSRLIALVLVCLTATSLAAQAPTFRTGANYIRVDMYPTRDGAAVTDLRVDEVELLEDGVAQTIDAFEHVFVRPAGSQDTRVEPDSVAASRQMTTDPRARVFVIFLDTLHTQIEGSANMRLPVVRFLDRVLGQDDLVAVMTPEMSAADLSFGRKTTVISTMMQNEWTWGRRGQLNTPDPKESTYEACYPDSGDTTGIATEMKERRRERLTFDALEDLVGHLRGVREERKAVLTVTEGWRLFSENKRLASVVPSQGIAPPPMPGPFRRGRENESRGTNAATGSMMAECEADRVALALEDHTDRLRRLTEDANRGNVTFYPVFARGLAPFDAPIGPDRPPTIQQDRANLAAREDSLRQMASDTDGTAVLNTNNIDGALARIVADLSSYYLLGYYSSNTKLDGRFRNITVRVKRPGVQVRARRGYRGLTAEQMLTAAEGEKRTAAAAASPVSVVVNPRAPFRIRTSAWTPPGANAGSVWIVGELDYRVRRDLAWSAGATAEIVAVAGDGREVVNASVPVAAGEGTFTLRIPESGGLPPGDYALRVRVKPESNPSLPLVDSVRLTVPAVPQPLGEPVMLRRGPSTGLKHLATADPRFQRNERVRLEMASALPGTATARLLDRVGNPLRVPVQIAERPDASGFRWIVADAVLAPLASGDYAIEVKMGDATRVASFKVVP